jgi:23S rRNA A1618 N6-methylase RlmF
MQTLHDCKYLVSMRSSRLTPHRWDQHKSDFFNDPECVMQLTKTLLKLDFGLQLELPDDRLCPPVSIHSF